MLRTYTEILLTMADALDAYIAPKKITRSDTNFIYLLLKAIAKGYEIVNNVAESLRNKFNPESCTDADLYSVAKIAGTEYFEGTGSGLLIAISNPTIAPIFLDIGEYAFDLDDDTSFEFPLDAITEIPAGGSLEVMAFTPNKGSFPVDAVASMTVYEKTALPVDPNLVFSCQENSGLLGSDDETSTEFRKRILTDVDRQDTIKELETAIKNLPYVFDCKLFFNNDIVDVPIDGIIVPPFHLLVTFIGAARNEIAELVAKKSIYPTVMVNPANVLHYYSDVFSGGVYDVYYNTFGYEDYNLSVRYAFNSLYIQSVDIESAINNALNKYKKQTRFQKYLTEAEFYDTIKALDLKSFELLDVSLFSGPIEVPYIEPAATKLPRLDVVSFTAEDVL